MTILVHWLTLVVVQTNPQNSESTIKLFDAWLRTLFKLAPAPDCNINFDDRVNLVRDTYANSPNTLILRHNEKTGEHSVSSLMIDEPEGNRHRVVREMWEEVRKHKLPPFIEFLVNVADLPRLPETYAKAYGIPIFSWCTPYGVGTGFPDRWTGIVPFPTHFNWNYDKFSIAQKLNSGPATEVDFRNLRPVLYFRGRFSEIAWKRYGKTNEWENTPRFKLAYATRHEDEGVDVKITGFALHPIEPTPHEIEKDLFHKFNITMSRPEKVGSTPYSQISLIVDGNGWAGATAMHALLNGGCPISVSKLHAGLGETYFPFLLPWVHYVPCTLDNLHSTVHNLLGDTDEAFRISQNAARFAKKFLTRETAVEYIKRAAWRYWEYMNQDCNNSSSLELPPYK